MRKLFLKLLERNASHWVVLFIDVVLMCLSFILSYIIRFNTSFNFETENLIVQLPFISIISICCFWLVGSNRGIIRHTGLRDAVNVLISTSIITLVIVFFIAVNYVAKLFSWFTIPRSIILIFYFISTFILIGSRFIFKGLHDIIINEIGETTRILIYGAGDSGLITYNALKRETREHYDVFGFIDDDKSKIGKKIDGVRIYSRIQIDEKFIEKYHIKELIFSMQNIKPERLLYLTDKAMMFGLKIKIVPPLSKWIDGDLNATQIREVKIEDLLDRKPINIENSTVRKEIENQVVLVTGSAGSIGSEISRQVCYYKPKHVVLIDQAESPLYDLQQELIRNGFNDFTAIVSDVRDKVRMDKIFEEYKPNKVFHAAAYKHVPLMENSPYEAIKINIGGTKNIADLSVKYKVERFVMVSTDKAVNPTNVMGATKRVAEMYVSSLAKQKHNTKFTVTRFGNVLGSNGSVIPLFKKQIEMGGALTVTHKDITRFFMTIPEACQLVLQAGTMGNGGEIYIFDMGKSVKIFDMAKRMIYLSGLKYPEDIDIKITGLRPGEKLYEELLANNENTIPTYHKKIMIAKTSELKDGVKEKIEKLCVENEKYDDYNSVRLIKEIVPEFVSNNSIYEKLDVKK